MKRTLGLFTCPRKGKPADPDSNCDRDHPNLEEKVVRDSKDHIRHKWRDVCNRHQSNEVGKEHDEHSDECSDHS